MFFTFSAAFGYMRNINQQLNQGFASSAFRHKDPENDAVFDTHKLAMYHKVWNNLAGMLLFLFSTIMGATLLWIGRRNKNAGRQSAV